MLGRVVMLEDHVGGGVTSKTYLNVTLRTYAHGGQNFVDRNERTAQLHYQ